MLEISRHRGRGALCVAILWFVTGAALAEDDGARGATPPADGLRLASAWTWQPETTTDTTKVSVVDDASPFSFDIAYYLYSDYVFRGVNLSEYAGEGREKPNHQVTTALGVDIGVLFGQEAGTCGIFTFETFFEWFAAQKKLDPVNGGHNLQEVDYLLSWSYDVEPIASTFTLGYTFYAYPNAKAINTQEWWVGLDHNDAWMWKWLWPDNNDGVLNPSLTWAMDVDAAPGGSWIELGVSHEFQVSERCTLSPVMTLAIDHRYLDPILGTGQTGSTRFAYVQYGLETSYDLTSALEGLPWVEGATLSAFLYFNDALGNTEDDRTIQDEFFGGMSLGFSF